MKNKQQVNKMNKYIYKHTGTFTLSLSLSLSLSLCLSLNHAYIYTMSISVFSYISIAMYCLKLIWTSYKNRTQISNLPHNFLHPVNRWPAFIFLLTQHAKLIPLAGEERDEGGSAAMVGQGKGRRGERPRITAL